MKSAPQAERLPILVVDDDSALIRTLADILRLHGYAPTTAGTGEEGLRLARHQAPALAVVDLRLPDMDGMELANKLHALSAMTEVVILTGNASVESAVAALREHSVDYLLKPVDVQQLLNVAHVATERWQRRQAEEARATQQGAVAALGRRALASDDASELLQDAARLVSKTLDVPFCGVLERRSDGETFVYRAVVGSADIRLGETQRSLTLDLDRGYTLGPNEITVAIPGPVQPYGVIEARDYRPRDFTRDDAHFLEAMAHVLGAAVERDRTETALRQSQRMEAVGRLASGVAHDFNNMLSAITAYAELVREGLPGDSALRHDVGEILGAAGRAAGLTRQLLAFSRQQVLQPRLVRLNDIITQSENMLRRLIGDGIEVVMRLDEDLDWVKADPGQIEQVILNLCVNARDAMPSGGKLTIETANGQLEDRRHRDHPVDRAEDYVMLAVTDTGVGMDAEIKARIFEPFFTTKEPEKGTGLGLATVYGIVKQSGGDIHVYSEPGRGTSVKIFLPRTTEVPRLAETPPVAPPGRSGGTETLLFAEDEDAIRRVAERILGQAGYTVLAARNGREALKIAETHPGPIHLLVTDMAMPEMNGRELAERATALRPAMRVLYLSGYTDATVRHGGLLATGALFLQKPFATEAFARKVREALDTPRD